MVCSLSFLITSRVPQQDSDLSTRLPSAQHGHRSLQWPSGSPEQMLCTVCISCVRTSHLPCISKRIPGVLWRFLIPCPVQVFLLGKSQPGLWETSLLVCQAMAEGKIDTAFPVHSIPSCMSILRWVFTLCLWGSWVYEFAFVFLRTPHSHTQLPPHRPVHSQHLTCSNVGLLFHYPLVYEKFILSYWSEQTLGILLFFCLQVVCSISSMFYYHIPVQRVSTPAIHHST